MDLLKRELAPITPEAWKLIDEEASRVLKLNLAGRKIVDFRGPFGWDFAAVNGGRLKILPEQADRDLNIGIRQVDPVIEVRVPIVLPTMELDTVGRGAENPDLEAVVKAAEKIAHAEDNALFNGFSQVGIQGILPSIPHRPIALPADVRQLPHAILAAQGTLRQAGISGPYVLVLSTDLYNQVYAATTEGYPLAKRIEQLLVDHPIVRAGSIEGGVLLSTRGGDYELLVGQDLSIGYAYHQKHEVELYITESFAFRVLEPSAAVRLAATA